MARGNPGKELLIMSSNDKPISHHGEENPPIHDDTEHQFSRLVNIMRRLLGPGGCPWDREQTHKTLKPYLVEEAYEVIESIDSGNYAALREELGDVLLQIVFHSEIARLDGRFDIADVIKSICDKMERRHPHVFGKEQWASAEEVLRNWEDIKKSEKEKKRKTDNISILEGIPRNLPSLIRAHRIQDRAARVGFDWKHIDDVYKKVLEEIDELHSLMQNSSSPIDRIEDELGDLLFALVNLSRFLKVHPEEALQRTTEKFIRRFKYIENEAHKQGRQLKSMTLEEMDTLWEAAKRLENTEQSS